MSNPSDPDRPQRHLQTDGFPSDPVRSDSIGALAEGRGRFGLDLEKNSEIEGDIGIYVSWVLVSATQHAIKDLPDKRWIHQ